MLFLKSCKKFIDSCGRFLVIGHVKYNLISKAWLKRSNSQVNVLNIIENCRGTGKLCIYFGNNSVSYCLMQDYGLLGLGEDSNK